MKQKSKVDHVKTVEEKEIFNQQSKEENLLYIHAKVVLLRQVLLISHQHDGYYNEI